MLKEMKTLSILFSEPNVFSVLPEWPENQERYYKRLEELDALYEQSKANAIRIENILIIKNIELKESIYYLWNSSERRMENLKLGDIFQVEGFEYERKKYCKSETCTTGCNCVNCEDEIEVAILKLAKEEEPKEKETLLIRGNNEEYNQAIDDVLKKFNPVFEIKPITENLVDIIQAFKLLHEEIEKLKKQ